MEARLLLVVVPPLHVIRAESRCGYNARQTQASSHPDPHMEVGGVAILGSLTAPSAGSGDVVDIVMMDR